MSDGSTYHHSGRWDSITGFGDDAPSFNPINFAPLRTKEPTFDFSSAPPLSYNVSSFSHDLPPSTVQPNAVFGTNSQDAFVADASFFSQPSLYTDFSTASQRYGQLTPPDDLSPKTRDAKGQTAPPARSEIQSSEEPEEARSDNKRKRSSTKSKDGGPRKRGRKSTAKVEIEDLPPEEAAKREQFLERNRVAAHKCRQKKKEWMVNLDDRCRDLQAHNKVLTAAVGELNEEVFRLKNILFQHTDCQFAPIQTYINQSAEKLRAQAASLGGAVMFAAPAEQVAPPRLSHDSHSSVHSRYGSAGFEDASDGAQSVGDRAASCSTADPGDEAWTSMLTT